jgi:hypothetical protein
MNKVIINYFDGTTVDREWLEPQGMRDTYRDKNNKIEVSDGHHTMSELYEHRYALFCALVKIYDNYITPFNSRITCYKSRLHHDGTMYPGWFIVMMVIKQFEGPTKQISYHLPLKWWDKFKIMELASMWEWDGHDSNEVLKRLGEL